jgi:hypothetical protein
MATAFNFASEYAIGEVHEKQVGLKSNGTHQLLACADDVNLLADIGLEMNLEKLSICHWLVTGMQVEIGT